MDETVTRFLTYMQIQTQTYYIIVPLSVVADIVKSDWKDLSDKRKSELREGLPIAAFTVDGRLFEFEITRTKDDEFDFQWVIDLCYQTKDGNSRRNLLKASPDNLKVYFDSRPIKTAGVSGKRALTNICETMTKLVGSAKLATKAYPESEIRFLDGDETTEAKIERKQNA